MLTKKQRTAYAAWMGKRSYHSRLERLGIEKLREIARENGKLGGRPRKDQRQTQKGGKRNA